MRQKFGWLSLVLFLVMLVSGFAVQAQDRGKEGDGLDTMLREGWKIVAPGVLQRPGEGHKVETFAVGPEGLRWVLKDLQGRLNFMKQEYRRYQTDEIRKGIVGLQRQIAKVRQDLAKMKDEDSLESAISKAGCSVSYGSSALAEHLTNVAGVKGTASANFNNTCGYSAETYAYAYARATHGTVTDTFTQEDPRTGASITSNAAATIQGTTNCHSEAYSYARYTGVGIFLSFSDSHDACPAPAVPPPSVSISGPTYIPFLYSTSACVTKTWTSTVTDGSSPFTYQWKYNGTVVGSGTSYSRLICPSTSTFTVSLTVTDSLSQQGSASLTGYTEITGGTGGGGTGGCSTSNGGKVITTQCQ